MAKEQNRIISGTVFRTSKDKTGVLLVSRLKMHPKYRRSYKQTKKFLFHDVENICKIGEKAEIIESRRYSKRKSWRLYNHENKKVSK